MFYSYANYNCKLVQCQSFMSLLSLNVANRDVLGGDNNARIRSKLFELNLAAENHSQISRTEAYYGNTKVAVSEQGIKLYKEHQQHNALQFVADSFCRNINIGNVLHNKQNHIYGS